MQNELDAEKRLTDQPIYVELTIHSVGSRHFAENGAFTNYEKIFCLASPASSSTDRLSLRPERFHFAS